MVCMYVIHYNNTSEITVTLDLGESLSAGAWKDMDALSSENSSIYIGHAHPSIYVFPDAKSEIEKAFLTYTGCLS